MEVVARVRENEIGLDVLEGLERLLHVTANVGKKALAELQHAHVGGGVPRKALALFRASSAREPDAARTTHVTWSAGRLRVNASNVPPQPISMSSA